jgi:hypothetical protein
MMELKIKLKDKKKQKNFYYMIKNTINNLPSTQVKNKIK